MSDSRHPPLSSLFPFSLKDLKTTLFILAIAVGVCILLQRLDPSAGFAMPVFVLAVLLTSAASFLNFSTFRVLSRTGVMVPAPATQPPGQPMPSSR